MPTLSMKKTTVKEKPEVIEEFGTKLHDEQNRIRIPQWHKDILDKREKLIMEGKAKFVDMETAKQRIANRVSERLIASFCSTV